MPGTCGSYHFGSKEGPLVAVVQAVEEQQRVFLAGLAADPAVGTAGFLDGIVGDWLEMLAQYSTQLGSPPEHARADARLGVAVMCGLLLDLLATGDRAGADEAVERFILLAEAAAEG